MSHMEKSLSYLDVSDNDLININENIFPKSGKDMDSLHTIIMSACSILDVHSNTFRNLKKLTHLDLSQIYFPFFWTLLTFQR